MAKLTKPARIGATIFRPGVDERLVIERAQREYEYQENTSHIVQTADRLARMMGARFVENDRG